MVSIQILLEQEAPGLVGKLEGLALERQQEVLRAACLVASKHLHNLESPIRDLVGELAVNRSDLVTAAKAASLAGASDAEYLSLQAQNAEQSRILTSFSKARFLTALAIAFGSPSEATVLDGIYELLKGSADPSKLLKSIEDAIEQRTNR